MSYMSYMHTFILSTRWIDLYTSVTNLDFDDCHDSSDSFMNFVDRVLFFHDKTSIKRFRLRCGERENDNYAYLISGWTSFALKQRV